MKLKVEYSSTNVYENSVKSAHWQLLVLPENNKLQVRSSYLLESNLKLTSYLSNHLFSGELLNLRTQSIFTEFTITVISEVELKNYNPFSFELLEVEQEKEQLNSHEILIDHNHFLFPCEFTALSEIELRSFELWGNSQLISYLQRLMAQLHDKISYSQGQTSVATTASQALKMGQGVCQDYSHIFIGIVRSQGIPARYTSGYLCSGQGLQGEHQMHAWVECFVPGVGWLGFDPTNKLLCNQQYIKVTHGRNYLDCTPIKGVLETRGMHSTFHSVKISQLSNQQQ